MTGAGRTPVREAFLMLQKENLIEIFPRSGTCAKRILPEDITQLYQLRKLIEPTVAIKYKNQIDSVRLLDYEQKFNKMRDCTELEDERQFYALDIEFHQFIVDSAGNDRLTRIYRELMQDTYRVGILSMLQRLNNPHQSTYSQHCRIIRAILMENDEEINAAFTEHINASQICSLEALRGTQQPSGQVSAKIPG